MTATSTSEDTMIHTCQYDPRNDCNACTVEEEREEWEDDSTCLDCFGIDCEPCGP
jgi:hypothetical protein